MSKTYVFGIGGTGARVIKALTLLLGAGVKTQADEIVPILIDPDAGCGDNTDTVDTLREYIEVRSHLNHAGGPLNAFATKILPLDFAQPFSMPMGTNTNVRFGQYMGLHSLSPENQAMANMLFSKDNQQTDMTNGFYGNPNIGSVVLNQFGDSNDFQTFSSTFQDGDKIFIISSIFGGSGASGFPLLLKNLRQMTQVFRTPNAAAIQDAPIGAITVMPYFQVKPADTPGPASIDSDTFISKTKAALSYYDTNLTGLDAHYYIGDEMAGQQEQNPGGAAQRNDAHFVELAAALAVLDFADSVEGAPGHPTTYKEFGIEADTPNITFTDLGSELVSQIAAPMTSFTLAAKYLQEKFPDSQTQRWFEETHKPAQALNTQAFRSFRRFSENFLNWEKSMQSARNNRRFMALNLSPTPGNVFELAKGYKPSRILMESASNWDLANSYLNKTKTKSAAQAIGTDAGGKFVAHILTGIEKVSADKIRF